MHVNRRAFLSALSAASVFALFACGGDVERVGDLSDQSAETLTAQDGLGPSPTLIIVPPSSKPSSSTASIQTTPTASTLAPETVLSATSSPTVPTSSSSTTRSFPERGSEECTAYNGCAYEGRFAALAEVQTRQWVAENNIIAVHEKDFAKYELKTLRIRRGEREIEGVVFDKCADDDCAGCCSANLSEDGFLIDLEIHTMQRFGVNDGLVEWTCIDC